MKKTNQEDDIPLQVSDEGNVQEKQSLINKEYKRLRAEYHCEKHQALCVPTKHGCETISQPYYGYWAREIVSLITLNIIYKALTIIPFRPMEGLHCIVVQMLPHSTTWPASTPRLPVPYQTFTSWLIPRAVEVRAPRMTQAKNESHLILGLSQIALANARKLRHHEPLLQTSDWFLSARELFPTNPCLLLPNIDASPIQQQKRC